LATILKENALNIYTDGSCLPSPRRGGIGIYMIYTDSNLNEITLDFSPPGYRTATNNQMEIKACVIALKIAQELDIDCNYRKVVIHTDSQYVWKHYPYAKYVWPKNKWFNRDGRPILNVQEWKDLVKEVRKINKNVEFKWVKGHSKDPNNKKVDKLAKESAKNPFYLPTNFIDVRRKKTKENTEIDSVKMLGQRISIRIITAEFLRTQKVNRYRFEVISKNSEFYGKASFVFSEDTEIKAGHSYYVVFNKNDKNPRIVKVIREINIKKKNVRD
jgi:ribonuclease HI